MSNVEIIPPWSEDRIERLILKHDGNLTRVAGELDCATMRLRKFVRSSPRLSAALEETFDCAVDEAVDVLYEGLRDRLSFQNRFYSAKEFLRTTAARKRGFGQDASGAATLELKDKAGQKTITLRWLEPPKEEG